MESQCGRHIARHAGLHHLHPRYHTFSTPGYHTPRLPHLQHPGYHTPRLPHCQHPRLPHPQSQPHRPPQPHHARHGLGCHTGGAYNACHEGIGHMPRQSRDRDIGAWQYAWKGPLHGSHPIPNTDPRYLIVLLQCNLSLMHQDRLPYHTHSFTNDLMLHLHPPKHGVLYQRPEWC